MIDLHIHSNNSDGDKSVIQILEMGLEKSYKI